MVPGTADHDRNVPSGKYRNDFPVRRVGTAHMVITVGARPAVAGPGMGRNCLCQNKQHDEGNINFIPADCV